MSPQISKDITMTSETEETALAPCPFCGCDRIYERGFRCFECPECRAEGPTMATKAEAIAAWNTRAAPSRAPEAGREDAAPRKALRQEDVAYLTRLLARDLPAAHCGEGALDRRDREAAEERHAAILAALSPPSTGGEGEAVAWIVFAPNGAPHDIAWSADSVLQPGFTSSPLYFHPPETGKISREEIVQLVDELDDECWPSRIPSGDIADAILSKLKESGLSREGLGGSARASRGAAGPSDCAEGDAPRSDGWFKMDAEPAIGRKFIALYNDGSGAAMFWRHPDGLISQDGDDFSWPLSGYDRWAYLPDELEFWCENGEEPMTLHLPPQNSGGGRG